MYRNRKIIFRIKGKIYNQKRQEQGEGGNEGLKDERTTPERKTGDVTSAGRRRRDVGRLVKTTIISTNVKIRQRKTAFVLNYSNCSVCCL